MLRGTSWHRSCEMQTFIAILQTCWAFSRASQSNFQQALKQPATHSPSPIGWRRESEEQRREEAVDQNKDSLIREEEKKPPHQVMQKTFTLHCSQAGWCPVSLQATATLGKVPPVLRAASCSIPEVPLVSWGQWSWLCLLPVSCPPPAYSLEKEQSEKQRPWHCSAIAKISVCY